MICRAPGLLPTTDGDLGPAPLDPSGIARKITSYIFIARSQAASVLCFMPHRDTQPFLAHSKRTFHLLTQTDVSCANDMFRIGMCLTAIESILLLIFVAPQWPLIGIGQRELGAKRNEWNVLIRRSAIPGGGK